MKRLKRLPKKPRSTHQTARTAENQRRPGLRRRLFSKPALIALALVGLVGAAYYLLYQSPYFKVSEVTVAGANRVNDAQVVAAAEVEGLSVLNVSTKNVAAKVRALPLVKDATARIVLPNRVVIAVKERQPWAIWQSGATKYVVDDQGVVLSTTPDRTDGLITVTETQTRTLKLGNRIDYQVVRLAQALNESLPRAMGVTPKRFEYAPTTGLTVTTDKGIQIRFGDGGQLDNKLATGKAILAMATDTKRKVSLLDLRFDDRPYFR